VTSLPHPSATDITLMSASSVAALAVCARLARRTGDAGWTLWAAAMSVFVGSLVLRAWPGPIAGDRATALRLASSATAAIAAAGVARRLPGGVSRVTALDMVPPVLAVSAVSIAGAAGQVHLGYSDAVTHMLYPSAYAALLLLATELGVRRRGRPSPAMRSRERVSSRWRSRRCGSRPAHGSPRTGR
jgi:hypothetical protein